MKKYKYSLIAAAITTGCLQLSIASAEIRFSGFFNAIGNDHDADQMRYLEATDDAWGYNNTSFGFLISSKIDDKLTVAAQLIGGGHEGDGVGFDWGFATYKTSKNSLIKFGKIKYPGNLYSEIIEVGYVYPWVRAPESIYSENAELFFEAFKGLSYKYSGGNDTEFSFEAYTGSIDGEDHDGILEAHKRMTGLVFSVSNEIGQVKLSYNDSVLSVIDTTGISPVAEAGEDGKHYTIIALGGEAMFGNLQVLAEVAQSSLEDAPDSDGQGWYLTFAYSMGDWKPHFTLQEYALDDASVEQSSMTFGLNRQLSDSVILKIELQKIEDIIGNGFFEDHLLDTTNLADGSSVTKMNISLNIVF